MESNHARLEKLNMEVQEFLKKKRELELDILHAIAPLVDRFYEDTGYSPCDIVIDFMDVSRVGASNKLYALTNAKCRFDILE